MEERTELTPRERRFVDAYEQTWNGTEAALAAGYGKGKRNSCAAIASRLLKTERIREEIARRRAEEYAALDISKETLTGKLADIVSRCMEGKPHLSWNSERHEWEPDGTWMFDANGAVKAIKLLGDSIGMFTEKVQVSGSLGLEQYLKTLEGSGSEF